MMCHQCESFVLLTLYVRPSYTVSFDPFIVPTQLKRLSPSGNAVQSLSPLIINDISSDCSRFVTFPSFFVDSGGLAFALVGESLALRDWKAI